MKNKKFTKKYQLGLIATVFSLSLALTPVTALAGTTDSESTDSVATCVAKRQQTYASASLKSVRKKSVSAYKNRLKQIDKLQAYIKNSSHKAVLQERLEAARTRADVLGKTMASAKDAATIHQATCEMLYELRLNSFWPAYLTLLKKTDPVTAAPDKLRALAKTRGTTAFDGPINYLEYQNQLLVDGLLALTPQSVPPGETTNNVLKPYASRRTDLVKEANAIKKEIAAIPRKKASKPKSSTVAGLPLPPNFKSSNKQGNYYLLPTSPDNHDYYIYTKTMPGGHAKGGAGGRGSPDSQRYGRKLTIAVFYTAAVKYKAKYGDSKLVAGDLNAASEHATHDRGIDIDIYSSDRTAALTSSKGGSDARSIELGKMLVDTRHIDWILFNDHDVIREVNAYAKRNVMRASNSTHDYHFHVRVK